MIAAAHRLDNHDSILNALPHPVVSIAASGMIVDGNAAAEAFFQASIAVLRRHMLRELVPFGSPSAGAGGSGARAPCAGE